MDSDVAHDAGTGGPLEGAARTAEKPAGAKHGKPGRGRGGGIVEDVMVVTDMGASARDLLRPLPRCERCVSARGLLTFTRFFVVLPHAAAF